MNIESYLMEVFTEITDNSGKINEASTILAAKVLT